MKGSTRVLLLALGACALSGCAVGEKLGWHRGAAAKATAVQVASCDAATSTLKQRPDHDVAHRACVEAKVRQGVD